MIPVRPPIRNCTMKPIAKSIGVRSRIAPPIIVAINSKYSIPAGIARTWELNAKKLLSEIESAPVANM